MAVVESPVDIEIPLNPVDSDTTTDTSLGTIGVLLSRAQLFNDYEDRTDRSSPSTSATVEPEAGPVRPIHMRCLAAATLLAFCLATAACDGDGDGDGTMVFGDRSEPCPATVLTNDSADDQKMEDGANCVMTEFEAGRPVVWDVIVPTVEGDPIPTRYEFDGDIVTITTDFSHDAFGRGGVEQQRCDGLRRTIRLPEGIDCDTAVGEGFESSSLPGGS